ncbi:MAG: hypothetical protein H7X91_12775, partial [Burkholderiales bacterium]|nr:hypothetical protein [Burkholderiales bacterium]
MNKHSKKIITIAGLIGVMLVSPAIAQDQQLDLEQLKQQLEAQSNELAAERRALEEQEAKLAATKRALAEQQRRLNALQTQITGKPAPGQSAAHSQEKTSPEQRAATPQPVGQAPDASAQAPEIPALVASRGVLTPRNSLILEPSLQYSHSSSSRV